MWLERSVAHEPISGGYSGAPVERHRLDDGTTVVVKHLDPANDWQMRATADDGRELWAPRLDGQGRDLDAALAAQASSVIPALVPSALDAGDSAHRRQTSAKLDWWIRTLRDTTERL